MDRLDDHQPDRRQNRKRARSPYEDHHRDDRQRNRSPPPPRQTFKDRFGRDRDPSYFDPRRNNRDQEKRTARETPPPRSYNDRDRRRGDSQQQSRELVRQQPKKEVDVMEWREDEDEDARMKRIMGFEKFRSTKNTKVPGNDKNYAVYKVKKTEYRQYMNREGGFNRPLSPSRM